MGSALAPRARGSLQFLTPLRLAECCALPLDEVILRRSSGLRLQERGQKGAHHFADCSESNRAQGCWGTQTVAH